MIGKAPMVRMVVADEHAEHRVVRRVTQPGDVGKRDPFPGLRRQRPADIQDQPLPGVLDLDAVATDLLGTAVDPDLHGNVRSR